MESDVLHVPIQLTHGCLVASIQIELDEAILAQFQSELLARIQNEGPAGVILDVSGVELMDVEDFEALRSCTAMARVMGTRALLVGLQPGVVSALIDLDVDLRGIEAKLDLEEAFRALQREPESPAESSPVEEPEPASGRGAAESEDAK